jgi:hypothetical protein
MRLYRAGRLSYNAMNQQPNSTWIVTSKSYATIANRRTGNAGSPYAPARIRRIGRRPPARSIAGVAHRNMIRPPGCSACGSPRCRRALCDCIGGRHDTVRKEALRYRLPTRLRQLLIVVSRADAVGVAVDQARACASGMRAAPCAPLISTEPLKFAPFVIPTRRRRGPPRVSVLPTRTRQPAALLECPDECLDLLRLLQKVPGFTDFPCPME